MDRVTGRTPASYGMNADYFVIKYDSAGNVLWSKGYDAERVGEAFGVAVDSSGNVYDTGYVFNASNPDYCTIKYQQADLVLPGPGILVAPNTMSLSVTKEMVRFWLIGDMGGETAVLIYNSAGHYMGSLKVALGEKGTGSVEYGADGIDGRRPAPGAYFAVSKGGGVSGKKKFFVLLKR